MTDTETIVRNLVRESGRTKILPSPEKRTFAWLCLALPFVVLVAFMMGFREDLPQKAVESRYLFEQGAALAVALSAAFAAFWSVVPAAPRWTLFAPLVPIARWLGSLGAGCIQDWAAMGAAGLSISPEWACLPGIAMVGSVPGITMAAMLRRGAPIYPHLGVALGGLAAAAIGNFGLRLFHDADAGIMVLVWQFGTVALWAALAGLFGPHIHSWRHAIPR
jgi:hypothetical protein